jgi:hypothetical protein
VGAASKTERRNESEPVIEPPQATQLALTRWIWADQAVRGFPEMFRGTRSLTMVVGVSRRVTAPVVAASPQGRSWSSIPSIEQQRTWEPTGGPVALIREGKAQRRLMPPVGGGARESRSHGEGRQQALSGWLGCGEVVVE